MNSKLAGWNRYVLELQVVHAHASFGIFSFFANRPSAKIVSSAGNSSAAVPLSRLKGLNVQMNEKKIKLNEKVAMNRESALLFIFIEYYPS